MKRLESVNNMKINSSKDELTLPIFAEEMQTSLKAGNLIQVDGTNVIRVPFGVRQAKKKRPERPERWATLVLPFQSLGGSPTPPQAA